MSERRYQVVVNAEEQYSLWPADQPPPEGWQEHGFQGVRSECLAEVERVWTDITPKSARTRSS